MAEPPKRPNRPSQATRASTARPIGGRTSQVDRAMALRDAVEQAVEAEKGFKRKSVVQVSRARLIALLVVALPLLAGSVYAWVARPEFIWGPAPRPVQPAEAEANLRVAMFLLAVRLDMYREEHGFYPASLDAMGEEELPAVSYELVADSLFELRGVVDRQPVIYRSDMTAEEFLRNSKDLISGRRR